MKSFKIAENMSTRRVQAGALELFMCPCFHSVSAIFPPSWSSQTRYVTGLGDLPWLWVRSTQKFFCIARCKTKFCVREAHSCHYHQDLRGSGVVELIMCSFPIIVQIILPFSEMSQILDDSEENRNVSSFSNTLLEIVHNSENVNLIIDIPLEITVRSRFA